MFFDSVEQKNGIFKEMSFNSLTLVVSGGNVFLHGRWRLCLPVYVSYSNLIWPRLKSRFNTIVKYMKLKSNIKLIEYKIWPRLKSRLKTIVEYMYEVIENCTHLCIIVN